MGCKYIEMSPQMSRPFSQKCLFPKYAVLTVVWLDRLRTAVPFWEQTTQILNSLSRKRDCSPERGIVLGEVTRGIPRAGYRLRSRSSGECIKRQKRD